MTETALHIPASRKANKAQAAEFFAVSLPTVNAWIQKGAPVLQRGDRGIPWVLDLLALAEWRFSGNAPSDELSPRERRDHWDAELKRIEFEKRIGQLLSAEDTRRTWAETIKAFVLMLDTLPDVVERDARLSPEQATAMASRIDLEREQLARQLTSPEAIDETE